MGRWEEKEEMKESPHMPGLVQSLVMHTIPVQSAMSPAVT